MSIIKLYFINILPDNSPIPIETMTVSKKLNIIVVAIYPPYIGFVSILSNIPPISNILLPTTLKRIIATASLTIPYPNIIENIFGNFIESINVRAATESVAEIVALYLTISPV
jgi:hypothetical protein